MGMVTYFCMLGLLALGAAAWLGTVGGNHLRLGHASMHWPTVKGKILRTDPGPRSRKAIDVAFTYQVGEQSLVSRDLWFGLAWDNGKAQRQYSNGQEVTVYYDPDDPALAVLQPGLRFPQTYVWPAGAALALAVSLVFFSCARARYRSHVEFEDNSQFAPTPTWSDRPEIGTR